jgi:hypothetical protein
MPAKIAQRRIEDIRFSFEFTGLLRSTAASWCRLYDEEPAQQATARFKTPSLPTPIPLMIAPVQDVDGRPGQNTQFVMPPIRRNGVNVSKRQTLTSEPAGAATTCR